MWRRKKPEDGRGAEAAGLGIVVFFLLGEELRAPYRLGAAAGGFDIDVRELDVFNRM